MNIALGRPAFGRPAPDAAAGWRDALGQRHRHALRQQRAPELLDELHALLTAMRALSTILPQSVAGKAINYALKRWVELTRFLDHPVIELSTDWAKNPMKPGRHWKEELAAPGKQRGWAQDRRDVFHRRKLPQTERAPSPVSGRHAARLG
jgi:hypothetical protein